MKNFFNDERKRSASQVRREGTKQASQIVQGGLDKYFREQRDEIREEVRKACREVGIDITEAEIGEKI